MAEITERVENLETILGRFIINTDRTVRRLDRMIEETQRRIDQLDRAAEETNRRFERITEGANQRLDRSIAEWRTESAHLRQEMNRKWGELANKMGTIVEDIVAPNMPRIAREYFDCQELERCLVRCTARQPANRAKTREFDVICIGEKVVVWNETKATARQDYIDDFMAALPEFFDYFPEYRGRASIPVFASLQLPPHLIEYLTRHRIYGLAMNEETMDLVNFRELSSGAQEKDA